MNLLNDVIIEGRLVRDAEVKSVGADKSVANFTVANNRYFKKTDGEGFDEEVSFFDVQAWDKLAETAAKCGTKGRLVRVRGKLKQDRWSTDAGTRSRVLILASHIEYETEKKTTPENKYPADELAKSMKPVNFEDAAEIPF